MKETKKAGFSENKFPPVPNPPNPESRSEKPTSLQAARARVEQLEMTLNDWFERTDWIQKSATPKELGMHRLDAIKNRIEALERERNLDSINKQRERIKELEEVVASQLRVIKVLKDSDDPTLTVIQQLDQKDQRIAELEADQKAWEWQNQHHMRASTDKEK